MKIRNPVVAGKFYPESQELLREWILRYECGSTYPNSLGGISPHAGYIFSGNLSNKVWSTLPDKEVYVILGPNHTGMGPTCSLSDADIWHTPLGDICVNNEVRDAISEISSIEIESSAHIYEHSIEVQLPFLQFHHPQSSIVPMVIAGNSDINFFMDLGKQLLEVHRNFSDKIAWIISSDMNHYESYYVTLQKDEKMIAALSELDPFKIWDVAMKYNISMCGLFPSIVILSLFKELGQINFRLLEYSTSAEVSGDYNQVVGYLGAVFLC